MDHTEEGDPLREGQSDVPEAPERVGFLMSPGLTPALL